MTEENQQQDEFKNSRYKVPNLERALVMMEHLLDHPEGRSITELTDDLGISKNSVFRISMTLMAHGFLIRDDQKRFSLSKKLLLMGCRSFGESRFIEYALEIMRQCRDEVKESVFIGSLVEDEGVVIEQVLGSYPFKYTIDPGMRLPIHCSAPCKAILAYLPEKERDRILDATRFKHFNENTITNRKAYLEELAVIRECGYALDRAEQLRGTHCVSAPVFNQFEYPIAAIWATGPADRMPMSQFEKMGKIILRYANMISFRMGYNAM